jgi:ribosome-binding factor A
MRPQRLTRVNQLLKQEVAEQLFRIMHEPGFDAAACTVTRVITSSDLRHARVLVSIRAEPDRQQELLGLISRHRKELQDIINRRITMKYTPQLAFELDESIAKGDDVLSIIAEMEEQHPDWERRPGKGSAS